MPSKLRQETLTTLVIKAQKGDRYAYSQIVLRFQNLAVGYAYSILRNFPLAEEAAQEALLEAYLNLYRLQKPAAFPGWLKRIVFKQCNRITRKKTYPTVSLTQTEELICDHSSPTRVVERQELRQIVQQTIELLPEDEREVITLFYLGERSQKEISAFLEVPVSTIKNRLFSARKQLKTKFNHMVEDYLYSQRPSQDDTFVNKVAQTVEAVCNGDIETIQTLIQQDTRLVNVQSQEIKSTPLHFAAHRGYLNIVTLLLDAGANVNGKEGNYSQSTALHWAASGGHLEVVKLLVKHEAKLNVTDNWNNLTPIGWTTILRYDHGDCPMGNEHQEIREYLLNRGANLDIFSAIILNDYQRVLTIAANSRSERKPRLLKAGYCSQVLQQRLGFALGGLQPLHYAIQEGKTEIAKLLIEQGADLLAKSYLGITPLCMAIQQGNQQIIELLSDKSVPQDLASLLILKQWSQAQSLIETKPDLLIANSLLLHYVIKQGLCEATSWLIDQGIAIEVRAKYLLDDFVADLTPLQTAVETNQFEIVQMLIERGADVNAQTTGELEITALHDAAADGYLDLIRLLVESGADLNARDNISRIPLDWAKYFQQSAAVELLEQLSKGN
ncbi:MAG: sigma-70 family RNA polymerase sigma factor [Cyanobacteria bacterium P01_A01_bin.83]